MVFLHIDVAIMNGNVPIRWHDVNLPWLHHSARSDNLDGQIGTLLENAVQVTGSAGIKMLGEYNGRGEVFGQGTNEDREGLNPSGGRTHNYQFSGSRNCLLSVGTH